MPDGGNPTAMRQRRMLASAAPAPLLAPLRHGPMLHGSAPRIRRGMPPNPQRAEPRTRAHAVPPEFAHPIAHRPDPLPPRSVKGQQGTRRVFVQSRGSCCIAPGMGSTTNAQHHHRVQIWNAGICVIQSSQSHLMFSLQSLAAMGAHRR